MNALFTHVAPYLLHADGITLSGGEALWQTDSALALLSLCKQHGIHTAVETSGLLPASVYERAVPLVDLWLFGVRARTGHARQDEQDEQREQSEQQRTARLQQNLSVIAGGNARIIARIPMVPGVMDAPAALLEIQEILDAFSVRDVWLNPWNTLFQLHYDACGLTPAFAAPDAPRIEECAVTMHDFFMRNGFFLHTPHQETHQ